MHVPAALSAEPEGMQRSERFRATWSPSEACLRRLYESQALKIVSLQKLETNCWSKLTGPQYNPSSPCHIVHGTMQRKVHGYNGMLLLTVPRFRCTAHRAQSGGRLARYTFVATDPHCWSQIEDLKRRKQVVITLSIVVISEKLILTMEGYMCVLSMLSHWEVPSHCFGCNEANMLCRTLGKMLVSNFEFVKTAAQWYQARTTHLWQWMSDAREQLALHIAYLRMKKLPGVEHGAYVDTAWDQVRFISVCLAL